MENLAMTFEDPNFRALKPSNVAIGIQGPKTLQSGEFQGPKILQSGNGNYMAQPQLKLSLGLWLRLTKRSQRMVQLSFYQADNIFWIHTCLALVFSTPSTATVQTFLSRQTARFLAWNVALVRGITFLAMCSLPLGSTTFISSQVFATVM